MGRAGAKVALPAALGGSSSKHYLSCFLCLPDAEAARRGSGTAQSCSLGGAKESGHPWSAVTSLLALPRRYARAVCKQRAWVATGLGPCLGLGNYF